METEKSIIMNLLTALLSDIIKKDEIKIAIDRTITL